MPGSGNSNNYINKYTPTLVEKKVPVKKEKVDNLKVDLKGLENEINQMTLELNNETDTKKGKNKFKSKSVVNSSVNKNDKVTVQVDANHTEIPNQG